MKFNFDFLKDRYDYELKRKDQITAALTLPVGVLIALGTVMAAMARSFSYRDRFPCLSTTAMSKPNPEEPGGS